jgi:hypothetical protein
MSPAKSGIDSGTVHRLVEWAARLHLWEIRCLARSLALEVLLPEVRLTIGVRRTGSALEAHAWIEGYEGPIGDPSPSIDGFSVLYRPGRMGARALDSRGTNA